MFALIDRENMQLLAVGQREQLNDLWMVQHTNVSSVILSIDPGPLQTFTFLELQLLTRNMCGNCSPTKPYSALVSDLVSMLRTVPAMQHNPMHLAAQAQWIRVNDPNRESEWLFAPGAMQPRQGLFGNEHALRSEPAAPDNPVMGKYAHAPARWPTVVNSDSIRKTPLPEPVPGEPGTVGTVATPRPPRAPAAPREPGQPRGSVSVVIWQVADEMWEAAGKPTEKSLVLKLRKEMMTTLEEQHAVKRNSASNELGNWQKARIS